MSSTELQKLREVAALEKSLKMLECNPHYGMVINYLFETKSSDLTKALGMTELGSTEYKQLLRELDAISVVRKMFEELPSEVADAQENLNQLSTEAE